MTGLGGCVEALLLLTEEGEGMVVSRLFSLADVGEGGREGG